MASSRRSKHPTEDEFATIGGVDFEFSFAFQPIVNAESREVVAFEALVRGPHGEPSSEVFAKVPRARLYRFDQACRLKAIHLARRLNLQGQLNLNLFPNAVARTARNIRATLQKGAHYGFPPKKIVFEVSEAEKPLSYQWLARVFRSQRELGCLTAIDDFGSGYSGLGLLVEYQPNSIKLDRNLISDIHRERVKQVIVKSVFEMCSQLSVEVIAEGVEKVQEYIWLREAGIKMLQGYYFAPPTFEALAGVHPGIF